MTTTTTSLGTCGCDLMTGRCRIHAAMLETLYATDWSVVWHLTDAYGEVGFMPDQGYDWSGIRDSSTAAIEAMWLLVQ